MATLNLGGTQVSYSLGAIIAIVVLVLCVVLIFMGQKLEPWATLALIGALALARLT